MKIRFTGTEENVLKILSNLPEEKAKAVRVIQNSIIIATDKGAKQVFKGDSIIIEENTVTVIER